MSRSDRPLLGNPYAANLLPETQIFHALRGKSSKPQLKRSKRALTLPAEFSPDTSTQCVENWRRGNRDNSIPASRGPTRRSLLRVERLAKRRDKKGVLELATQGHLVTSPVNVFKDPMVIEFLALPESVRLVESTLPP